MAFRNHKYSPSVPLPSVVEETYLNSEIVDGVERLTSSVRVVSPKLPNFDDYSLSAVLNSGQPLNRVSPILFDDQEKHVSSIIEKIVSSDSVNNSTDVLADSNNTND